jgi:hypothetical protein
LFIHDGFADDTLFNGSVLVFPLDLQTPEIKFLFNEAFFNVKDSLNEVFGNRVLLEKFQFLFCNSVVSYFIKSRLEMELSQRLESGDKGISHSFFFDMLFSPGCEHEVLTRA